MKILPLLVLFAATLAAEDAPTAIQKADLLEHLRRLASDEWEGRGSGTPGETKATDYIAARFAKLGFEPAGEGGTFFQPVEMPAGFELGKECGFRIAGAAASALEIDKEWRPFSLSSSGKAEGDVVFAGYGIHAPELGYDDYAGVDVTGKVVVIFRHTPHGAAEWRGPAVRQKHAPFLAKLNEAVKRGAIGLLIVNAPFQFTPREGQRRQRPDRVHRRGIGGGQPRIPFAHVTLAGANRLFPELFGATPAELEAASHAGEKPAPVGRAGKARVELAVAITRKHITGRNVCGLLRAGAADAVDEILVVGAHHDHLGKGGGFGSLARSRDERAQIHNGADDNGSGTAGVLEVARALASQRTQLRRSILFLTFTGEERGLLGSRYYVEHPTVPIAKMVGMLNMDMIGRLEGRELFIGGVKTSPAFRPILEKRTDEVGLKVVFGDGGRAPSDNTSFYAKKLPVLFFFSGMHRDYHRPSDDVERIDGAGLEKVARLVALTTFDVANVRARPQFRRADSGGAGPPRPILGISAGASDKGVAIGQLGPQSPAAQAGLQQGDVIIAIAGEKTPDLRALRAVMRKRKIGEKVAVKILRAGQEITTQVTLGRG